MAFAGSIETLLKPISRKHCETPPVRLPSAHTHPAPPTRCGSFFSQDCASSFTKGNSTFSENDPGFQALQRCATLCNVSLFQEDSKTDKNGPVPFKKVQVQGDGSTIEVCNKKKGISLRLALISSERVHHAQSVLDCASALKDCPRMLGSVPGAYLMCLTYIAFRQRFVPLVSIVCLKHFSDIQRTHAPLCPYGERNTFLRMNLPVFPYSLDLPPSLSPPSCLRGGTNRWLHGRPWVTRPRSP